MEDDKDIKVMVEKRRVTYPRVDNDENAMKIINAEIMITKETEIKIKFTYPLSHTVTLEFKNPNGFNQKDFFLAVQQGYRQIYKEEDDVVGDPGTITPHMLNRARSKGPHGIWGHYIGDLFLEGYEEESPGIFSLSMGS